MLFCAVHPVRSTWLSTVAVGRYVGCCKVSKARRSLGGWVVRSLAIICVVTNLLLLVHSNSSISRDRNNPLSFWVTANASYCQYPYHM